MHQMDRLLYSTLAQMISKLLFLGGAMAWVLLRAARVVDERDQTNPAMNSRSKYRSRPTSRPTGSAPLALSVTSAGARRQSKGCGSAQASSGKPRKASS